MLHGQAGLGGPADQAGEDVGVALGGAGITSLPGSDSVARIVAVVNVERARAGLAPLSVDPCLERWATSWADRTAVTQTFGHQDLGGMIRDCGGREVGENIGTTTGPVETLMGAWMDSPGHRENILGRQWTSIGVGASRASDGTWYAAQEFLAR